MSLRITTEVGPLLDPEMGTELVFCSATIYFCACACGESPPRTRALITFRIFRISPPAPNQMGIWFNSMFRRFPGCVGIHGFASWGVRSGSFRWRSIRGVCVAQVDRWCGWYSERPEIGGRGEKGIRELPNSCSTHLPRHTSRRVTPAIPSSPEVICPKFPNSCPRVVQELPRGASIGPNSA